MIRKYVDITTFGFCRDLMYPYVKQPSTNQRRVALGHGIACPGGTSCRKRHGGLRRSSKLYGGPGLGTGTRLSSGIINPDSEW